MFLSVDGAETDLVLAGMAGGEIWVCNDNAQRWRAIAENMNIHDFDRLGGRILLAAMTACMLLLEWLAMAVMLLLLCCCLTD